MSILYTVHVQLEFTWDMNEYSMSRHTMTQKLLFRFIQSDFELKILGKVFTSTLYALKMIHRINKYQMSQRKIFICDLSS